MTDSPGLATLLQAAAAPLSEWATCYPSHRAMGYLCSYVPLEIVHATGFTPVRLRATCAPVPRADAVLQPYACTLCRSVLQQALDGSYNFLLGVLFAHTCDAMQALADLWHLRPGRHFYVDCVMQPSSLGSPAARTYLTAEFRRLCDEVSRLAGRACTDDVLASSIAVHNETRRLVQALNLHRHRLPAGQFYTILDAAQILPAERFNALLAAALSELQNAPARPGGPRLFLVGAALDEPALLALCSDLDIEIVGDDLCTGMRPFLSQVDHDDDPFVALADYYLRRVPCPTKLSPDHDAAQALLSQVRSAAAGGVLFVLQKYCDPHAFERALLLPFLDQAGMPHLLLEVQLTQNLEGLRTRLQAFVEMF